MKATWNDVVIAQSDDTVVVEGNHYFPLSALDRAYVVDSQHHTTCPWKGKANYLTIRVGESENPDAAWYYPDPKGGAEMVTDRVAFSKGVQVTS